MRTVGIGEPALRSEGEHALLEHLAGRARHHVAVRQPIVLLELGVAHDQTFAGIPQHEGFVDVLDRGPEPHVRRFRAQRQVPLLGDVDGDADQLDLRRLRVDHLGAGAHPHPLPIGMAHAEHLVDMVDLALDDAVGELEEIAVVGMDDLVDLAERQHRVAGLVAQHVVHRARPVHLAAHHVPVP